MIRARLLGVVALAVVGVAATAQAATTDVGCTRDRVAVAHDSAGHAISPAPRQLVPCATETGFYVGETGIGVTKQGTVWFSAANREWALARTRDSGAHWDAFSVPGPQAFPGCNFAVSPVTCQDSESAKDNTVADAYLYVDPTTSKLFWAKTYGEALCSSLSMSPDDGASWQSVPTFACPGGDYEKLAAGPPPAGGPTPVGYPNVVYVCTNGPAPTFVVGPARICYKSLDGGTTWANTGAPPVPSPLAPGCAQFQEPQRVGPDGTLYLPLTCGLLGQLPTASVRVAISHDEGQTWSYSEVPSGGATNNAGFLGGVSLDIDRGGTVYVVWPGTDGKAYLAASKDQGTTWNGPLTASAPGVKQAGAPFAQVAALEPGHVAIAYYGYTGTDTKRLDGYLTESFNAADPKPIFYTGLLNDPAQPLYFAVKSGSLPRNDFLGVTIAPDGTPWTALTKLRSDSPDSEGFIQSTGYAGRLVAVNDLQGTAPARVKSPSKKTAKKKRRATKKRRKSAHARVKPVFTG
ncbi:MAG: hypothetical protein QOJ29_2827 [Thermoleophilaceae bacterium]|nr:hypothetical protein [Thermoleophilaceae bacterium]